jgi:hypothetical protein
MERLTTAVGEADPNTIVTFNHAYWPNQPETPPAFIKNLSADIHSHSLWMGMYGRYATTIGLPFDIMNGLTDTWAGTKPKQLNTLLEEVAAIISTGGSWDIGEFPASRGVQPADEMAKLAIAAAEFARSRKPWAFYTTSVPHVAILNSATTQYARVAPTAEKANQRRERELYTDDGAIKRVSVDGNDSRVYWFGGEFAQPDLIGAYQAFVENHVHFDIVNEDVLVRRIAEYELVVLPEQFALKSTTQAAIRNYIAGGGRIIATGSTIDSGLTDILGIEKATREPGGTSAPHRTADAKSVVFDIKPSTAKLMPVDTQVHDRTKVYINKFKRGRTAYFNRNVFTTFSEDSLYQVYVSRNRSPKRAEEFLGLLGMVVDELLPDRLLKVSAPAWFEVSLRRNDDAILVQLLNRAAAHHQPGERTSDDEIKIDLRMAKKPPAVQLQPDAEQVDWKWADNRLIINLSTKRVPVHRVLEVTTGG